MPPIIEKKPNRAVPKPPRERVPRTYDQYYRLEVEDLGAHRVIKRKDGSMVFTKKEDTEPQNKRIKKSKVKFYNEIIEEEEEEFMITLQKTEDGLYELTEE